MAALSDLEKKALGEERGSSSEGGDPGKLRDQGISNNRKYVRPFAWRPVRADNQTTGRWLRRHGSSSSTESRDDDCSAGKGSSHEGGTGSARPIVAWRLRGSGLGGRGGILRPPRSDPSPVHGSDPLVASLSRRFVPREQMSEVCVRSRRRRLSVQARQ